MPDLGPTLPAALPTAPRTPAAGLETTLLWHGIAALAAAALIVLCLLRLAIGLVAVSWCRWQSGPIVDEELQRLCDELRQEMRVRRNVALRELAGLGSPATIGWRRPVILLPASWPDWNEAERRAVLAHELAHIVRADYLRWLAALLSAAVHGYHPLVHWLVSGLRRDQELAADALAAGHAGGPRAYAQALCRLALLRRDGGKRLGLARAFLPAHVSLTRRVRKMLSRTDRSETALSRRGRVLLGVVLAAGCAAVAGLRCPVEAEESRTAEPVAPWTEKAKTDRDGQRDIELKLAQEGGSRVKNAKKPRQGLVQKTYEVADLVIPVDSLDKPASNPERNPPVADLVIPVAPPPKPASNPEGNAPVGRPRPAGTTLHDQLIKLIVETIAPQSWAQAGGPGTIDYYPLGMAFVINQTADVHEQIAELLNALRRLQDLEVSVEMRMLSVSAEMAKQLKREFGIECGVGRKTEQTAAGPQVVYLDDKRVKKLMESLQRNPKTNIMQAPKVTLFNGQQASIQIQDFQYFLTDVEVVENKGQLKVVPKNRAVPLGISFGVQATAAEDHRSVRVGLDMEMTRLASASVPLFPVKTMVRPVSEDGKEGEPVPFVQFIQQPSFNRWRVKHTVNVQDSQTAVLSGWKMRQEPEKAGQQPEDIYLLVAVTPQIMINTEEPLRQSGVPEPQPDLRELLTRYQQACQEGRRHEAQTLAAQALKLDPTCFSKER